MIPRKLSIKNFMCYRDDVPPLDLEGIHLACLCGDNGHGKSALLDSITWFKLTPKVMVIRRGEERVPDVLVAGSNYIACLGVSLLLWWIVKG